MTGLHECENSSQTFISYKKQFPLFLLMAAYWTAKETIRDLMKPANFNVPSAQLAKIS